VTEVGLEEWHALHRVVKLPHVACKVYLFKCTCTTLSISVVPGIVD